MNRTDFNNWLYLTDTSTGKKIGKPDWNNISYLINTRKLTEKQDIVSVFWNSYIYIEEKFKVYFNEFNKIPYNVFNDLIFEFIQAFPKSGRMEGVNYFDDLIEMLLEKYASNNVSDFPNNINTFKWDGTEKQFKALCEGLINEKFIDQGTTPEDIKMIFSGIKLKRDLHKVKWICKNNKGTVNKTALREFLTILLEKFQDKVVPYCFIDINNIPINLNKPKKNDYSKFIKNLETIISNIKKLPDQEKVL